MTTVPEDLAQTLSLVTRLCALIEHGLERHDAELAEIRDGMIELDHGKAARRDLEDLWSRVDELSTTVSAPARMRRRGEV